MAVLQSAHVGTNLLQGLTESEGREIGTGFGCTCDQVKAKIDLGHVGKSGAVVNNVLCMYVHVQVLYMWMNTRNESINQSINVDEHVQYIHISLEPLFFIVKLLTCYIAQE